MKIYWVYSYFPGFIFVADWAVSAWAGSTTYGPFIFIRPSRTYPTIRKEEAEGLRQHELVHVKQFYRTCGLSEILCTFAKWRLKYEVEAYREQLKYVPEDALYFAEYLSTRYKLSITKEEALALLTA